MSIRSFSREVWRSASGTGEVPRPVMLLAMCVSQPRKASFKSRHARAAMAQQPIILEAEGLTKEFKGFVAVKNVKLRVRRHTIHALIGPNGAGKSTCFNLLTHFLTPTAGRIGFNGRDITGSRPADIARLGLVRSFQISAVFPHLTVLENVRIALQRRRGASFDFWRTERVLSRLNGRARELLEAVGLTPFLATTAVELPYGRKRALEIATTL